MLRKRDCYKNISWIPNTYKLLKKEKNGQSGSRDRCADLKKECVMMDDDTVDWLNLPRDFG